MSDISSFDTGEAVYNFKDSSARQSLAGKQDALTFDSSPISGSTNPVTSGGVYSYVSDVSARVDSNETAIQTLNGTGAGSVKKTVADEIAKVVAEAPADFDTLKEISDWISGHESSAAAMNSAIQSNSSDIATKVTGSGMSISIVDGNIARLTYS